MPPDPGPPLRRLVKPGLFVLLLFGVLWWRLPGGAPDDAPSASGEAFGTTWAVKWIGDSGRAQDVRAAVEAVVSDVNASMSTYHPGSELVRFNRGAGTATISAGFARVLSVAKRVFEATGGAFDPTVGPLVDAWGFGPEPVVEPPTEAAQAAARARVGFDRLHLEAGAQGGRLSKEEAELAVDLSAIAKGYAVDEVSRALQALGLERHLVEIGGEVRAAGQGPAGPWRVGVERPQSGPRRQVFEVIPLVDRALATSGGYRIFQTVDGRRVTHIIDPRRGAPVDHGLGSVSVLHPSCTEADALATALYVLGLEEGLRFAESRGLAAVFLVVHGDRVDRRATSAFDALTARPEESS
mgnify:CR=1 FL=1